MAKEQKTRWLVQKTLAAMALAASVAMGAMINPAVAEGESVVLVATQKAGDRGPIDGLLDGLEQAKSKFGYSATIKVRVQRQSR